MHFDGFVKHLGSIDMNIIEPIIDECVKINWLKDEYSRFDVPLRSGKLIEFQYEIAFNRNLTDEQKQFITLCEPLVKIAQSYFTDFVKVRGEVATLPPGAELIMHYDIHWFQYASHRIHIPLVTSNECVQLWENHAEHLEVGNIYEINNRLLHSAKNSSSTIRTHLILDFCDPLIWNTHITNVGNPFQIMPQ